MAGDYHMTKQLFAALERFTFDTAYQHFVVERGQTFAEASVDRVVDRAVLRECTPIPYLFGHLGQEL